MYICFGKCPLLSRLVATRLTMLLSFLRIQELRRARRSPERRNSSNSPRAARERSANSTGCSRTSVGEIGGVRNPREALVLRIQLRRSCEKLLLSFDMQNISVNSPLLIPKHLVYILSPMHVAPPAKRIFHANGPFSKNKKRKERQHRSRTTR